MVMCDYKKNNGTFTEEEKKQRVAFLDKNSISYTVLRKMGREDLIKVVEEYEKNNQQASSGEQKTKNDVYKNIMQSFDDSFFDKKNNEMQEHLVKSAGNQ